jgi:hypothetical protein
MIYGNKHGIGKSIRINKKKQVDQLKGRFKKINVKERYLEVFIREML